MPFLSKKMPILSNKFDCVEKKRCPRLPDQSSAWREIRFQITRNRERHNSCIQMCLNESQKEKGKELCQQGCRFSRTGFPKKVKRIQQIFIFRLHKFCYCKVANRSMSCLVALSRIFRLLITDKRTDVWSRLHVFTLKFLALKMVFCYQNCSDLL